MNDINNFDSNHFVNERIILQRLIDKHNWISELSILKQAVRKYLNTIKEEAQTYYPIKMTGLHLYNQKEKLIHQNNLKLKYLQKCFHRKKEKLPCEQRWERIYNEEFPWRKIDLVRLLCVQNNYILKRYTIRFSLNKNCG